MSLKKTLKSVVLAGMTFAAGFGVYNVTHSKPEKRYATPTKAKTVQYQKITQDTYELHAGVLMPLPGETMADYEARRARLEKQENQLRARVAHHYRERLAVLQAQKASPRMIEAMADRLDEYQKTARYLSYYSPEGQERLKVYNGQKQSVFLPQRDVYDF